MDEIPFSEEEPVEGIRQLSSALLHEGGRGMRRDTGDLHASCGQLHHYQHIIGHQAMPRRHLDGEEVRGSQHLPVHREKLRPAHTSLAALRGGLHVLPAQDIAHSQLVDTMAQVRQGTLDPSKASGGILLGHAHDELLQLLLDTRTSELAAPLTTVELLGDQPLVPAQEGVRRGDGCHVFEALTTKWVGQGGEATALGVGEPQSAATELRFEDAVFFEQIRDNLLLVTLNPTGHYGNQHVEDHGLSSGWRQ
jgi:hypothetical protein